MQQVGIRELKNHLTHYLESVKNGDDVVVTDRGKPVAILHRLEKIEEGMGMQERLATLAARGVLTLPKRKGPLRRITMAEVEGELVSETIIKDRR